MEQVAEIAKQLGVDDRSEEEQEQIVGMYQARIGEVLEEGLSEEQIHEYQAIIDGHQEVINAWLRENDADYRDSALYKALDDEESEVPTDKVYASIAWIRHNCSNYETVVEQVTNEFRSQYAN
ncbi:hypothetical protein B7Y94_03175 [Candidatus Saccharibacteria bacterium 32-49-12]|nr:MAG: hypothetical protein B7Y94_03175 [Candidatus Saccharibacteria bacterium 32-49-12]